MCARNFLYRQESSRATEKAGDFRENKRACFSGNPQPFPCALAYRRAGKAGLPGSGVFSFSLLLRHTAWKISLTSSASGGARGGSSSPAGSGAAPRRSLCRCGTPLENAATQPPPRRGLGQRPGVLLYRTSLPFPMFLPVALSNSTAALWNEHFTLLSTG